MSNIPATSKINSVSICVPAFNEERCIKKTLSSIRDAMAYIPNYRTEILVCANACKDKTVDKIMEWAGETEMSFTTYDLEDFSSSDKIKDNLLSILITAIPGKPNAWNQLQRWADGDILIFTDADITLNPQSFVHLLKALENNADKRAAGGVVLAPHGYRNLLYTRMRIKMKEFATKYTSYINGPLYAIRKGVIDRIPEEILYEDAYLSMSIGIENIVKVPQAIAYQIPPNTYKDYLKRRIRDNLSDFQLRKLYNGVYTNFRRMSSDTRSKREREAVLTIGEKISKRILFPQTWLCKILDTWAKTIARRQFDNGKVYWYTCTSTKR